MMHDPLLGIENPAALKGIAARLRQSLTEPAAAYESMLALADRLGVAITHEIPTRPGERESSS